MPRNECQLEPVPLVVDLVLALVGVSAAVVCAWRGFIAAATALVGWVLGFWLGLAIAPALVGAFGTLPGRMRAGLVLGAVVLIALLCAVVLALLGGMLSRAVRRFGVARGLDSFLGAVLGLASWAVAVWLVAGLTVSTGIQPLAAYAQSSRIVQAFDAIAPMPPDAVFGAVDDALAAAGGPKVFEPGQEAVPDAAPPPADVPAAVSAVSASVLEVSGDEPACGTLSSGSGWVVSPERVVTNAHVVAGAAAVTVLEGERRLVAAVVGYDPETDLAILAVPHLSAAPIALDDRALAAGDAAFAAGYPGGGPYTISPARVRGTITAAGKDIYDQNAVERDVYSLRAAIRPGDSGGPLLDEDGRVAGVVFARSANDPQTGYALTLAQVKPMLDRAPSLSAPVSTGGCSAG